MLWAAVHTMGCGLSCSPFLFVMPWGSHIAELQGSHWDQKWNSWPYTCQAVGDLSLRCPQSIDLFSEDSNPAGSLIGSLIEYSLFKYGLNNTLPAAFFLGGLEGYWR